MPTNIPTDLLRTLVAIVDTGSISRATQQVFRSQSALSLQMRRLEELTQITLFRKDGRHLVLTEHGATLVGHARDMLRINDQAIAALTQGRSAGPIRVGLTQVFAEFLLPTLMTRFAALYSDANVHVRVSNTRELEELLQSDQLDLILGLANPDSRSVVAVDQLVWMGDKTLIGHKVIPLAVMEAPCLCREAAISALDGAGLNYRIVVETSNLAVLSTAIRSGLAITCQPAIYSSGDMSAFVSDALQLPPVGYRLRTTTPTTPQLEKLSAIIKNALRNHQVPSPRELALEIYSVGPSPQARDHPTGKELQLLGV